MRITNSMMSKKFLTESNAALNRVAKYQSQVDTTKKLSSISDDPQATLTALKARNRLSNLALYQSNISTASSYLKEAESATSSLNDIIQTAYGEIVTAQSGAKSQDELNIIAEELKNLQKEVFSISNSSMGTSYLFGGYNFTGKISGMTKQPPFSIDSVSGDISYNGINLSRFAWKNEFDTMTATMSDLRTSYLDAATSFAGSTDDSYTYSLAEEAAEALNNLAARAQEAMSDAKKFGIDPSTSAGYADFATFYNDITAAADDLNAALSKELAGDFILDTAATQFLPDGSIDYAYYEAQGKSVYTADELANKYSRTDTQTLLDTASALLTGPIAPPVTVDMDTAITNLSGEVVLTTAEQDALTNETGKTASLQIGTSQSIEMTLTGLDLLGTGENNIYHILGKAIDLLENGGDGEGLSKMLTSLQNAQSSVLNVTTKIGTTQNRMDMIGSRYNSSELNYTKMRSDAEDADMAESIINLTTAQTVYNAALAGGAEIIKTSLIDFLR